MWCHCSIRFGASRQLKVWHWRLTPDPGGKTSRPLNILFLHYLGHSDSVQLQPGISLLQHSVTHSAAECSFGRSGCALWPISGCLHGCVTVIVSVNTPLAPSASRLVMRILSLLTRPASAVLWLSRLFRVMSSLLPGRRSIVTRNPFVSARVPT